uniref:Uncharacterized protein n=1 Tax=Piliocolobus tephrosceles TaxID=591936 RepID=A0A8C9IMP6_9PRIM
MLLSRACFNGSRTSSPSDRRSPLRPTLLINKTAHVGPLPWTCDILDYFCVYLWPSVTTLK